MNELRFRKVINRLFFIRRDLFFLNAQFIRVKCCVTFLRVRMCGSDVSKTSFSVILSLMPCHATTCYTQTMLFNTMRWCCAVRNIANNNNNNNKTAVGTMKILTKLRKIKLTCKWVAHKEMKKKNRNEHKVIVTRVKWECKPILMWIEARWISIAYARMNIRLRTKFDWPNWVYFFLAWVFFISAILWAWSFLFGLAMSRE